MAPTLDIFYSKRDNLYHQQQNYNCCSLLVVIILFIILRALRFIIITVITAIKSIIFLFLNTCTYIWEILNSITRICDITALFIGFIIELLQTTCIILLNELSESFYIITNLHRIPYHRLISTGIRARNKPVTLQATASPEGSPFTHIYPSNQSPAPVQPNIYNNPYYSANYRKQTSPVKQNHRNYSKHHKNIRKSKRKKNKYQHQQLNRINNINIPYKSDSEEYNPFRLSYLPPDQYIN